MATLLLLFLAAVEPWMAQAAFDVTREQLPVPFEGNSVAWVLRYGTRTETFAFVLEERRYAYDRATGTATVSIDSTVTFEKGAMLRAYDVARTKLPPSTRAGPRRESLTTRPGVFDRGPLTVTKRVYRQTQIVAPDVTSASVFTVKIPAARAKHAKASLRVALICVPAAEQYASLGDPTVPEATGGDVVSGAGVRDFTDEQVTYYVALRADVTQVWLFDRATGEVYGRYAPSGAPLR
jgi:hypothetical protein